MPDATITSTASTFGTISGTFAADQSTITGTITAITGTVDGSVGVPGPQGPAGAAGPQGPQGDPGAPGQGVAAGGSTGQVLQKLSATSYDTGWLTLGTMAAQTASDYSTTAVANGLYYPLSGNPSGFLTASALTPYLEKAGGIITGNITSNNNASFISFDNVYKTAILNSASVQLNNAGPGGSSLTIEADGITFPGGGISKQTVAYPGIAALDALFYPLSGNPSGFLTDAPSNGSQYARKNGAWDVVSAAASYISSVSSPLSVTTGNLTIDLSAYLTSATAASTYQTLAGMSSYLTTATAASTYYLQTNPSGFQTAGDVTTALSPYLLSATAASTYAVIAAGQPVAGSAGQVLTKQSGSNWDSIWATPVVGDRYLTSSTTSNTVSNGNKTFTIGTGLSYTPTQNITISYNASNHMHGEVLTYNSGTGVLTVDVNHHTGSGTYTAWVVNVGGVTPATSVAWGAITGVLASQLDLQGALDLKLAATTAAATYYPLVGNPSSFLVAADITGKADLASPSLTGTPLSTTAAVDTNTTQIATTAFVVGQAASATPLVNGTAAVGTSLRYARADHVHGTDTTRMALNPGSITMAATGANILIPVGGGYTVKTTLYNPGLLIQDSGGVALAKFKSDEVLIPSVGITFSDLTVQTSAGISAATVASTYAPINAPTFTGVVTIPAGASISGYATTTSVGLKADIASPTFTGLVTTQASAAGTAGFRLPHGSAPTSPTNGDFWTTTAGLFYRINGATVSPATLAGGTFTGLVSTPASTATNAGFKIVTGIAPTTPVSGEVWIPTGATGTINFRNSSAVHTCALLTLASQNFTASGIQFSGATNSFGTSTAASTTNVGTGATLAATAKTVNIGTNGVATSTTAINIGSAVSTTTITLNGTVNATGLSNSVKAWVNFNGTGTVAIRASYNVSSITDNGVGNYTVNFTTALADANYAVSSTSNRIAATTQFVGMSEGTRATGSIQVFSNYGASGVLDTDFINVTVIR